ncbi:MAG: hypothetical protein J0L76_09055 [Rhodobacterales bacterium]|nr:hypothetical protein [Rhodobacterales bacterium]
MKRTALLALIVTAAPGLAFAQTITGGLTLSYGNIDGGFGGSDINARGLDGRMKVDFGNGATIGVQVGKIDMPISGTPVSLEGEFIGLDAGYRFAGGFRVGAYADRLTMGVDLSPVDITLKTNGLSLGYEGQGFDVEAFVGKTSISPPIFSADIDNKGITASYTGMPGLDVGATWLRAELTSGAMSENIDFSGVAASYVFGESFIAFGGVSQADFFISSASLDTMGLGLGYDLGATTGFAATVSLEVARTDLGSSEDIETVRLGLTVPLGAKGPALPMNSVADSILNPRHGAFNAAMTAAF